MKAFGIGVGANVRSVVAGCWLGVIAGIAGCSAPVETADESAPSPVDETTQAVQGENLGGANLGGTNLGGSNLGGANLGGANLGGTNLGGTNLGGTNLGGTNLGGNNLGGNNLGGTNLGGTNLGGTNLGGSNLGGTNLGGTNLGGTNLGGTNLGGNNLGGTNLGGSNLGGTNTGANIHSLGGSINGMLYSGEDLWMPAGAPHNGTKSGQCVVMGLGSTAFSKLLGQQSANATISVALGKLPWGFASTSGGAQTLKAWEAVVWGNNTYCSFVLAAPTDATWAGVAGFIKAVFRWNAPPSQTMNISGIEASAPYDTTLQTTISSYTGMMNAGSYFRAGTVSESAFVTGELGFVTATTNNESVMVDFSSWVRDVNGNAIVLGNVQATNPPTYAESVYIAIDTGNGTGGVLIDDGGANWWDDVQMPAGMADSTKDLDIAYKAYQAGALKPVPTRCGGALYLNYEYGEPVPSGKCDTGVRWPTSGCITGSQPWSFIAGTTAPMNTYMVTTQPGGAYERDTDGSCNTKPVISETYVHMWGPNYTLPAQGTNLALNGTASADSQETANPAGNAKDNNATGTRWAANDGNTGHWWKVDLGASYALTGSQVVWELAGRVYKYKVEVSSDNTNWTMAADRTGNTSSNQTQSDSFTATARYVRITTTGLASGAWASFYEFRVFGTAASCTAETDSAFCSRLGKNCGSVTAADNCGTSRTVSNCGTCTSPQTCGGGGTANVCGGGTTSAYLTGGTITASNNGTSPEDKSKAFDNSISTKWFAGGSTTPWIASQFSATKVVTSYKIGSANDAPDRDPKSWKLQGSNNGTTWTDLDTRTNETFATRGLLKSYTISNTTAYNRYKLLVTANNGAVDFQVAEVQLFGY